MPFRYSFHAVPVLLLASTLWAGEAAVMPPEVQRVMDKASAATAVVNKGAEAKIDAIKIQEVKDLQRIYDSAVHKGDQAHADLIQKLIDEVDGYAWTLPGDAGTVPDAGASTATKPPRAAIPEQKDANRHADFLKVAKAGNVDLLFLGDSITDFWRFSDRGLSVWDKYFAPLKAANFGISGDSTQHVLWRAENGELEGISPKLIVLMIGTNNQDSPGDIATGIAAIIRECHARVKTAKFLLLGIFPRGDSAAAQEKAQKTNAIIRSYADGKHLVYMDIGDSFLAPDKTVSKDIFPDGVHPNQKGYQLWAEAIINQVKTLLGLLSTITPIRPRATAVAAIGSSSPVVDSMSAPGYHTPLGKIPWC